MFWMPLPDCDGVRQKAVALLGCICVRSFAVAVAQSWIDSDK